LHPTEHLRFTARCLFRESTSSFFFPFFPIVQWLFGACSASRTRRIISKFWFYSFSRDPGWTFPVRFCRQLFVFPGCHAFHSHENGDETGGESAAVVNPIKRKVHSANCRVYRLYAPRQLTSRCTVAPNLYRRSDFFFHGGERERVNKFSVTSRRTVGRVFSEWLVFHNAIWRWTDGQREGWRIVWLNLREGTWDWLGERKETWVMKPIHPFNEIRYRL